MRQSVIEWQRSTVLVDGVRVSVKYHVHTGEGEVTRNRTYLGKFKFMPNAPLPNDRIIREAEKKLRAEHLVEGR